MKVRLTIEVDERDRLAMSRRCGRVKPATHAEVKHTLAALVRSDLDAHRNECCNFHQDGGIDALPCGPGGQRNDD